MEIFGFDVVYVAGVLIIAIALLFVIFTVIGVLLTYLFIKKNRLFLPKVSLFIMSFFEGPIKMLAPKFGIERKQIDLTIVQMVNRILRDSYAATPYKDRAVFLPHCIRWEKCPAPLTYDGIACKSCGQCPVSDIKKEADASGIKLFVCPGSTVVKRLIKQYRPKAIMGVGCHKETKEGSDLVMYYKVPAQAVVLLKDGCVNTILDKDKVIETMKMTSKDLEVD